MGLRERKKQRTRQEISDVATRLFEEHGFERVTLAQIADAAEVSVRTILNHFGSKEDLYFDRAEELRQGFLSTIVERPPGTPILGALRILLTENVVPIPGNRWDGLEDGARYELFRRFLAAQDRSPALTARRATLIDELGEHLVGAVAAEVGRAPDVAAVQTLAAMILAVLRVRDRVLRRAVAAGLPPAEVRRRVLAVVDDAFDRLEPAYADLDPPRRGRSA